MVFRCGRGQGGQFLQQSADGGIGHVGVGGVLDDLDGRDEQLFGDEIIGHTFLLGVPSDF
jgi:hypothetical protein